MNFIYAVAIAQFISLCADAQESLDSLKKYTYQFTNTEWTSDSTAFSSGASGFFVKHNGKVLIISAKHVFAGVAPIAVRRGRMFNSFSIQLGFQKDSQLYSPVIDVIKLRDTIRRTTLNEAPDIYVHRQARFDTFSLNSLESFLKPVPSSAREIIFFGYPLIKTLTSDDGLFTPASFFRGYASHDIHKVSRRFTLDGRTIADRFYYKVVPDSMHQIWYRNYGGFSGSPVFVRTVEGEIVFGGIVCAIDERENTVLILKPEFVVAAIDNKLSELSSSEF